MEIILVVTRQFAGHRIGEVIATQTQVEAILSSDHALDVVKLIPPMTSAARKKET
jgi:hypothetical protein